MNCSYCNSENVEVEKRKVDRWSKERRLQVKYPVCKRCWSLIRANRLPLDSTIFDSVVLSELKDCRLRAASISKRSTIGEVTMLLDSIDSLSSSLPSLVSDFEQKAFLAQQSAKRLEMIRSAIDLSRDSVLQKLEVTYQHARMVANKQISNVAVRREVFERDGFSCVLCGSLSNLTIDHKKPVLAGGKNELSNYQTLCLSCNCKKGSTWTSL